MISGLLGSVFSCVFLNEYTISYGASGAIFGLFGSILYFTYYYRATLQGLLRSSLIPVLAFNLILGFMIPGIDVWCHLGGLIGGVLVSMGIGLGDVSRRQDRINGVVVLILMFVAMTYIIMTK